MFRLHSGSVAGIRRVSHLTASGASSSTSCSSSSCSSTSTSISSTALLTHCRERFYKPILNRGLNLFRYRMGRIHRGWETFGYRRSPMDPKPSPESPVNDYYGRTRLHNPIVSKIALVNKKSEDFGWPHRRPPPTGLRRSPEYLPFFTEKYFPDVEVKLVLDSVINNETTRPMFLCPPSMSRRELTSYLRNIYGIDNVARIDVRNFQGKKYKNELGQIKQLPSVKSAIVTLDSPVSIDLKAIKGTEDTPDNKPQQVTA